MLEGLCFQQTPASVATGDHEEDQGGGGWPSRRACHTHERAIPIQETVEALDMTEEGKTAIKTIKRRLFTAENEGRRIVAAPQVWRRCSATWSCTPSASRSSSTQHCPSVRSAATTGPGSSGRSPKCTKPPPPIGPTRFHRLPFDNRPPAVHTVAPRLPWCWPDGG